MMDFPPEAEQQNHAKCVQTEDRLMAHCEGPQSDL